MKNKLLILFAAIMLSMAGTPVRAALSATAPSTVKAKEENSFKRKRKGYRKKKGFLWGLFRKNDCGCPKH